MTRYDVAVIGGGPAGYVGAITAARLGARVVLFERDTLGGTCLNRGCIPTKAYLQTAEALETIRHARVRGIVNDPAAAVDMPAAVAYKDAAVKRLTDGVAGLMRASGVEIIGREARLVSATEISSGGEMFAAEKLLLCGGSKPGSLPLDGAAHPRVLSSDELLSLTEIPKRLVIIGGGVVGCEMAAAFGSFGSEVTILELENRLLAQMDTEISAAMRTALEHSGVRILTGLRVERFLHEGDKSIVCCDGGTRAETDKILISTGRAADLSCLGALEAAVETVRGYVVADAYMRTNIPNLYACGDINGQHMLAHAAFKMGETAAVNALGGNVQCDLRLVPSCVYTMPEAAGVGLTEQEARQSFGGGSLLVGRFPFSANGRALACGKPEGFVKVLAERRYGEILGVHIFGAAAAELIAEPAALMSAEVTVGEVAEMVHAHPTYSEAFMEACADALGKSVHLPAARGRNNSEGLGR